MLLEDTRPAAVPLLPPSCDPPRWYDGTVGSVSGACARYGPGPGRPPLPPSTAAESTVASALPPLPPSPPSPPAVTSINPFAEMDRASKPRPSPLAAE
eukprot:173548-Chlamydomonas_euryale.AAC.2